MAACREGGADHIERIEELIACAVDMSLPLSSDKPRQFRQRLPGDCFDAHFKNVRLAFRRSSIAERIVAVTVEPLINQAFPMLRQV